MKIDPDLLTQAVNQYEVTMTEANRAVRDSVITPFSLAMELAGYEESPTKEGGCSKLRTCPFCPVGKGNYSTRYKKPGITFWGCPHCQNITTQ